MTMQEKMIVTKVERRSESDVEVTIEDYDSVRGLKLTTYEPTVTGLVYRAPRDAAPRAGEIVNVTVEVHSGGS